MSPGVKRKYPPADVQCTPQRPPAAKRSAAVVTTTAASATPINGAAVQDEWLEVSQGRR